MDSGRDLRLLFPAQIRRLPADLAGVVTLVFLTNLFVLAPVLRETPLRVVFGLPFVLFVPGYAFVAALFPEADPSQTGAHASADEDGSEHGPGNGGGSEHGPWNGDGDATGPTSTRSGIDGLERVALSFGLSIAVVPLLGLVLNFTPWGIRLVPIVVTLSGFSLVSTAVGARRRLALPGDERFRVPYRSWLAAARTELLEPESRSDAALNVLLVVSVLLATGSVGYAVAVPKTGESFTEFYLLTENESGDLVADDYPTDLTRGEDASLVVGVSNHEHEPTDYTIVTELQRVQVANNSTRVLDEQELRRFQTRLAHNETWHRDHTVTPTTTGERLRLQYLLYRGDPPASPSARTAYRELHLWVNVSAPR
jgi:uncharacterized membrane protein